MPVNRSRFVQPIVDADQRLFAFLHPNDRPRNGTIDRNRAAGLAAEPQVFMFQVEVDAARIGRVEFAELPGTLRGWQGCP